MHNFQFQLLEPPPECEQLRSEVRKFLTEELADRTPFERALSWSGGDTSFSRKLGARGWIGMTWPQTYGGGEHSALARYTVLEELLAAGAPVAFHWIADRQSGPLLLRLGSEEQKRNILPAIVRGECGFCIGMSEPDAGSDLASVRSTARPDGSGWVANGTKVWTSGAHRSNYMIALLRTGGSVEDRHKGLSQFLIPMDAAGVEVSPIANLAGHQDFNEVALTDVKLDSDALLGVEGEGWKQVTSELVLERSGPERFLSSLQLFIVLCDEVGKSAPAATRAAIGHCFAQLNSLRQMSLAVANMLQNGQSPSLEAAIIKDLGANFEQSLIVVAQTLSSAEPCLDADASDYQRVLGRIINFAPSFSLRGGTREILRGIIARGLGLR